MCKTKTKKKCQIMFIIYQNSLFKKYYYYKYIKWVCGRKINNVYVKKNPENSVLLFKSDLY